MGTSRLGSRSAVIGADTGRCAVGSGGPNSSGDPEERSPDLLLALLGAQPAVGFGSQRSASDLPRQRQ